MRNILAHIIFLLASPLFGQQNLVPNPGFELFSECPTGYAQICKADPWFQPVKCFDNGVCNCGSSDFFHSCTTNSTIDIPTNIVGFQNGNLGDGYIGGAQLGVFNLDISRECFEVGLIDSLQNGKRYCVSWYSSLADIARFGCNRIGAHFSADTLFQGGWGEFIPVIPQIENLAINIDTLNWSLFHQSFIAQGGEKFMTVGNFRPGYMIDTSDVINQNGGWAYYLFDDFAVYKLPEVEAGIGDSIFGYETTTLNGSCIDCWNGLQFTWEPSEDFEDPHSLNTQVSPDVTTTYYLTVQDTTGTVPCMDEVRDSVTIYVQNGPDFIVFPNPSTQYAPVKVYIGNVGGGSLTIRVHDIKGKLIYEKLDVKPLSTHELDLKLSAGMYTVTLNSEVKIVETKKLVIEE